MRIPESVKLMINQWGIKKTIKIVCMCGAGIGAAIIIGDRAFEDHPENVFEMKGE